jgi:uncharacterized protein YjbJ (UPF0337 family)
VPLEEDGPRGIRLARMVPVLPQCASKRERRTAMNWDRVEGNWKQMRGKIREKWGKLTDDDLDVVAGKRDQLVGRIQAAYGRNRDDVEREVDSYIRTL